tara:strand:- start:762 stop:1031 length:270 start_codon:yes stop_codon:yes gene_type:complete
MAITIANTNYTLVGAKNPVWGDKEKTYYQVECKFSHYESIGITDNDGYLPFAARADDPEAHGVEIFNACKAGTYGTIGDYVAPEAEEDE